MGVAKISQNIYYIDILE